MACHWEAATGHTSLSQSPGKFLPPENFLLSPGTVHSTDSEYGYHLILLGQAWGHCHAPCTWLLWLSHCPTESWATWCGPSYSTGPVILTLCLVDTARLCLLSSLIISRSLNLCRARMTTGTSLRLMKSVVESGSCGHQRFHCLAHRGSWVCTLLLMQVNK